MLRAASGSERFPGEVRDPVPAHTQKTEAQKGTAASCGRGNPASPVVEAVREEGGNAACLDVCCPTAAEMPRNLPIPAIPQGVNPNLFLFEAPPLGASRFLLSPLLRPNVYSI